MSIYINNINSNDRETAFIKFHLYPNTFWEDINGAIISKNYAKKHIQMMEDFGYLKYVE